MGYCWLFPQCKHENIRPMKQNTPKIAQFNKAKIIIWDSNCSFHLFFFFFWYTPTILSNPKPSNQNEKPNPWIWLSEQPKFPPMHCTSVIECHCLQNKWNEMEVLMKPLDKYYCHMLSSLSSLVCCRSCNWGILDPQNGTELEKFCSNHCIGSKPVKDCYH